MVFFRRQFPLNLAIRQEQADKAEMAKLNTSVMEQKTKIKFRKKIELAEKLATQLKY
jgi:hypothetical protein